MLETLAEEILYGGQFRLSTQVMKPNYLIISPTDATPKFQGKHSPFDELCSKTFSKCELYTQEQVDINHL